MSFGAHCMFSAKWYMYPTILDGNAMFKIYAILCVASVAPSLTHYSINLSSSSSDGITVGEKVNECSFFECFHFFSDF